MKKNDGTAESGGDQGKQTKTGEAQDSGTDKTKKATGDQTKDQTNKSGDEQQTGESSANKADQSGDQNNASGNADKEGSSGKSTTNVNVTVKQKTEIRQIVHEVDVKPVTHVDFNVTVGVAVPHTIKLHRLPPRIVKLVPAYEGYEFFILDDGRIVIVQPSTYEIVLIIS